MGKLENKIAIVTGGSRGIGRAIAEAYVQEGAKVIITANRNIGGELESAASEMDCTPVQADVTKLSDVQRVVNLAISEFGKIDILVNNAARGMRFINENF